MLGIIKKQKPNWHWALCGKHPVARDYLRMHVNGPMMEAFESWVEKGYHHLPGEKTDFQHFHSWRFWARGAAKNNIICGLIKDSSDSIGRPFPLMILGCGALDEWERHWHLLPTSLDKVWNQMEQCVSRQIDTVAQLETMTLQLKSPHPDWAESRPANGAAAENPLDAETLFQHLNHLAMSQVLWIPLTECRGTEPFQYACSWLTGLKNKGASTPQAVFIGGTMTSPNLVFLSRSLKLDDFQRLWQISTQTQNGER